MQSYSISDLESFLRALQIGLDNCESILQEMFQCPVMTSMLLYTMVFCEGNNWAFQLPEQTGRPVPLCGLTLTNSVTEKQKWMKKKICMQKYSKKIRIIWLQYNDVIVDSAWWKTFTINVNIVSIDKSVIFVYVFIYLDNRNWWKS